ncbi:WYL domain-containing protein [bacterium]|nr:MAG: WYL domain-containing protein [bacterium]
MSKIEIGDVVSLTSHPYNYDLTSVIIAGEPQFVPPLMVVIEMINDTKTQFNEKTGDDISVKGSSNCKCIWYSSKSNQFEENWVYSKDLKIIQKQPKLTPTELYEEKEINSQGDSIKIKNYFNATLKTSVLELSKIKSTISTTSNSSDSAIEKTTNNSLLSFVSPVLQVTQIIEVKTQEQKEPIFDARTGIKKRIQSEYLVKCKWFNANSDKISEKLIPINALQIIPLVSLQILKDLKSKIKAKVYAKFDNTVLQLKGLSFLNGHYYIKGYDYLTNKNTEIEVSKNYPQLIFIKKEDFILREAPKFDFTDGQVLTKEYFSDQYKDLIQEANHNKYYIRIKYKNRNDKVSTRTLKDYSIFNVGDIDKPLSYLTAFCISKDAERTFNINQVQQIQILNLKY